MLGTLLKSGLHFSGALRLLRALVRPPRALVLRYHSVAAAEEKATHYLDHGLTITPAAFEGQLQFLQRYYTIVPLQDLVRRLQQGLPPHNRTVALTFDDGFRDNYTYAFPLLCRYRMPATFYLTTGCIDNRRLFWVAHLRYLLTLTKMQELQTETEPFAFPLAHTADREEAFRALVVYMKNIPTARRLALLAELSEKLAVDTTPLQNLMMTWEEVRAMHAQGMSFGAHTVTHPNLPNTTAEEAEQEIRESKETTEAQLRAPVLDFSYPNGRGSRHITEEVKEIVRRTGFLSAVTSVTGGVELGDDLLALKRVGIYKKHGSLPLLSWEVEANRVQR